MSVHMIWWKIASYRMIERADYKLAHTHERNK